MAQESRLVIVIDSQNAERNARNLGNELNSIEKNGDFATKSMDRMSVATRSLAGYMAGVVTIGSAISKMDLYTGINNKLKLVTNNQEELNQAMDDTFAIAQRSASSWSAVNDVYSKYMSNAKTLNLTLTMIKIIYKQDPLSEEKTIEHAETIGQWLTSKYEHMPEHVRIFHTSSNMDHAEISFANEVTPKNAHDLKQLDFLPGTFIVIENPKGMPALIAAIVSIVLSVAIAFLMPAPSIAQTTQNNNQSSSANNELSNRENKMRVNGRIADIYGAAWDTADLIAVPYKVYENNVEVEHVVGCIGRGHYHIKGAYDGETNIVDILQE